MTVCGKPTVSAFAGGSVPCGLELLHDGLCQPAWPTMAAMQRRWVTFRTDAGVERKIDLLSGEVFDARGTPLGTMGRPVPTEPEPVSGEVVCTAEEARRRAEENEAMVAPATAELDAYRQAAVKAVGKTRDALMIFARMAECRARRGRMWAEAFTKAADLLDDVAEGYDSK